MKKLIFVSAFFFLFSVAPHVFAQGFVPLAPIPGLTEVGVVKMVNGSVDFGNFSIISISIASVSPRRSPSL